jgi:hypothetical protein
VALPFPLQAVNENSVASDKITARIVVKIFFIKSPVVLVNFLKVYEYNFYTGYIITYNANFCKYFLNFLRVFIFLRALFMDKFGIFKLLNSFFDFYKQNSAKVDGSLDENSASNPTNFSLENLGKAFSFPNQKKEEKEKTKEKAFRPLQSEMLKTISNHQKIEQRVKKEPTLR